MAEDAATQRLFVALMLGEDLGGRAAGLVRRALGLVSGERRRGLRLYGARELHLTLFFLGAVAAERREELEAGLDAALEELPAPELELSGAGAFPDAGRPRILWLGVRERSDGRLADLARHVRATCVECGFEADPRPFAAHVTVGRVRAERRGRAGGPDPSALVPQAFFALEPSLDWKPSQVALVESRPGEGQDAYRTVRAWALAMRGE